jgi:protein SCO1/2
MKFRQTFLAPLLGLLGLWVGLFYSLKIADVSLPPPIEAYPTERLSNGELPVLWPAPQFSAIDQHGRRITNQDLRGHVWIADFIFTRCTSACPIMTAKMILMQKDTPHPEVRFVSFSVDPDHDTPEVLKQYAAIWKGDESRWLLLSTDRKTLYRTAAGMRVAIMPTDDQDDPVLHSSLFLLVDQQGQVRRVYNSSIDDAMRQLPADVALLANGEAWKPIPEPTSSASLAVAGERLFVALGCAGCHHEARIAPPLAGVFGSTVTLTDGSTVTANEAYLRESLLDPTAKIVTGYLGLMPNYRTHLNDTQVDQLVAYLRTLDRSRANDQVNQVTTISSSAPSATMIDPVCGMEISMSNEIPHAEHEGQSYHFCSDHCRAMFIKNPTKYANRQGHQ